MKKWGNRRQESTNQKQATSDRKQNNRNFDDGNGTTQSLTERQERDARIGRDRSEAPLRKNNLSKKPYIITTTKLTTNARI